MCNMNDVVSARNACGSLCLRNRSFCTSFAGRRAHMLDRMLGAHSNVFQPAACFLSEPVQRGGDSAMSGGEVACRARLLCNLSRARRAVSGPNLCPGARRLPRGWSSIPSTHCCDFAHRRARSAPPSVGRRGRRLIKTPFNASAAAAATALSFRCV